jgi:hypothetical protein
MFITQKVYCILIQDCLEPLHEGYDRKGFDKNGYDCYGYDTYGKTIFDNQS